MLPLPLHPPASNPHPQRHGAPEPEDQTPKPGCRIFPNPESCRRLVTARVKEHHEDWVPGRRYIDMSVLEQDDRPEIDVVAPPENGSSSPLTEESAPSGVTQES